MQVEDIQGYDDTDAHVCFSPGREGGVFTT